MLAHLKKTFYRGWGICRAIVLTFLCKHFSPQTCEVDGRAVKNILEKSPEKDAVLVQHLLGTFHLMADLLLCTPEVVYVTVVQECMITVQSRTEQILAPKL